MCSILLHKQKAPREWGSQDLLCRNVNGVFHGLRWERQTGGGQKTVLPCYFSQWQGAMFEWIVPHVWVLTLALNNESCVEVFMVNHDLDGCDIIWPVSYNHNDSTGSRDQAPRLLKPCWGVALSFFLFSLGSQSYTSVLMVCMTCSGWTCWPYVYLGTFLWVWISVQRHPELNVLHLGGFV